MATWWGKRSQEGQNELITKNQHFKVSTNEAMSTSILYARQQVQWRPVDLGTRSRINQLQSLPDVTDLNQQVK